MPNENLGAAGLTSSGFDVATVAGVTVGATDGVIGAGVAENENPPKRGVDSVVDVVVLVLACGVGKLKVTVRTATVVSVVVTSGFLASVAGVETGVLSGTVGNGKATAVVEMDGGDFGVSFVSWPAVFGSSIVLDLAVFGDSFRTDVVVAVLNVTDVLVVKLTDVDTVAAFSSAFSFGFSTSSVVFLTLSTSSFESSPRRKLSIIANFDF